MLLISVITISAKEQINKDIKIQEIKTLYINFI